MPRSGSAVPNPQEAVMHEANVYIIKVNGQVQFKSASRESAQRRLSRTNNGKLLTVPVSNAKR